MGTPAELGIADQNRSDRAGFALPIVGGRSGSRRALRTFKVRQCSKLNCQLLRFFISVSRNEVAAKDNLVLTRLPPMFGGLCSVVRDNLGNVRQGDEG